MSRIGKLPIDLPEKVNVSIANGEVTVEGPKGKLSQSIPGGVDVAVEDSQVVLTRSSDSKRMRALHGLTRALVANMVTGVTDGFSKTLRIAGLGYKAEVQGKTLNLQLNHSHPVLFEIPAGIDIAVQRPETIQNQPEIPVIISGIDRQQVGQVAADIRDLQKPEPYKGKGIKYHDEHIRRKAGKAAGGI